MMLFSLELDSILLLTTQNMFYVFGQKKKKMKPNQNQTNILEFFNSIL